MVAIDRDKFRLQILEGYTVKDLMKYWDCSRTLIHNRKDQWGFVGLSPNSKQRDNGDGTKTCKMCGEEKPLNEYYSNGYYFGKKKTKRKLKGCCKPCENFKKNKMYANKINEILKELERDYKCEGCGYDKNIGSLSFHHEGEKNFEISEYRNRSKEVLKNEIKLCKVLCLNCHGETHNPELNKIKLGLLDK